MLTLHRPEPKPTTLPNVCKLSLDIAGILYKVVPLRSDSGQLRGFKLTREDNGTSYTLTSLGCSCPSSTYAKRQGGEKPKCKHYRAALACGLALNNA